MTGYLSKLPLFPTSVIGSLPRPAWLLEVLEDYLNGRISRAEWNSTCDKAIPFAVALQEAAGIDVITDGEWRREGYFQVFYDRVRGFQPGLIQGRTRLWPAVVGSLQRQEPTVADGVAFLRKQTKRTIKVTLPSLTSSFAVSIPLSIRPRPIPHASTSSALSRRFCWKKLGICLDRRQLSSGWNMVRKAPK